MTPAIARIRRKAKAFPRQEYTSLYHHVYNRETLRRCHDSLDGRRAVGIDGVSKADYGQDLANKAITDNSKRCNAFGYQMVRILYKWLNRQSQRKSYTWKQFNDVLLWIKWPPP